MTMLDDVAKSVAGTVEGTLSNMQKLLGGSVSPAISQRRKLSASEQVERFLSMSDEDLEVIKAKYGPAEYQRYTTRMLTLAKGNK